MAVTGFDEEYYLGEKLAQVQVKVQGGNYSADVVNAWLSADTADLKALLNDVGVTPEQHYEQQGWMEGLNPNAYFNAHEYVLAKATAAVEAGKYTTVDAAETAFYDAWTSNPYDHYLSYGASDGIDPSNAFDSSAYLDQKVAAAIADGKTQANGSAWTADALGTYLSTLGLTPLTHFLLYGQAEGFTATEVPADEQVDPGVITPTGPGNAFSLTTGIDNILGSTADDVINGLVDTRDDISTLNNGDTIDGGAGNDILNVTMDQNQGDAGYASTALIENVENVNVHIGSGTALNFDASNIDGVEVLNSDQSVGRVTFDNIQSSDITVKVTDTQAGVFANFKASALVGDDDTVSVVVEDVLSGPISVGAQGGSTDAAGVENIALTSQGVVATNTINYLSENGNQANTLTVDGTNNLEIENSLSDKIDTVDASTLEGGLTATVTAERAVVKGGLGDDVITVTGTIPESDIDLGTGDDLLEINSQDVNLGEAGIVNVETLRIEDQDTPFAGYTVDFDGFSVNKVEVIDNSSFPASGPLTLDNYDNATPLAFLEDYSGNVTVIKAVDTNDDSLSVSMEGDRAEQDGVVGSVTPAILNISDVETLNIDSSQENMLVGDVKDSTGDISSLTVNDASTELESVVLTGTGRNTAVVLKGFDKDLKTIDASAMTGNVLVDVSDAAADIAYTGAQGDNVVEFGSKLTDDDSITTGDGDDEVRADLDADAVTMDSDGVETVSILSTKDAARMNLDKASGLTNVIVEKSSTDLTLDNLADGVAITMEDGAGADLTIIDAQAELSIAMENTSGVAVSQGTIDVGSDVETLNIDYTDDNAAGLMMTVAEIEGTDLETLNLSASRNDTLDITGVLGADADDTTDLELAPSLTLIDGSDSLGSLALNVNTFSGKVLTGLADDTVTLNMALTDDLTIDAGSEDNTGDTLTFAATDEVSLADMGNITGFENYASSGALTLALSKEAVASAQDQSVTIEAAGALTLDLSDLTADQTTEVTGNSVTDVITIGAAADTVDLSDNGGTVIVTDVTDMSTDTLTGDAKAASILQFTDGIDRDTAIDLSNVSDFGTYLLTGTQQEYNLEMTDALMNGAAVVTVDASDSLLVNIDASSVTADVVGSNVTYALNFLGSDNNDIVTGTLNNDTLEGGAGNDYLTGGAGADKISGGTEADTITGGTGADTINFGTALDAFLDTAVYVTGDSGITTMTVDTIEEFTTAVAAVAAVAAGGTAVGDALSMGVAGSATNFVDGSTGAVADVEATVTDADLVFDGTVQYYFDDDTTNGYFVADMDADSTADLAIVLTGVIDMSYDDIVA